MQSLWMLLAAFFFALQAAFVKLGSADAGALEFVASRGCFGMLIIGLWALAANKDLRTRYFWSHMKRSFLGCMGMSLWFYSIGFLPLGTSQTLNNTSPLFMAALLSGIALYKKRPLEWPLVGAIIAGFFGVTLILRPEFHAGDLIYGLCGLSSGLFASLAYYQIKELTMMREPTWRVVFYFSAFCFVWGSLGHLLFEGASTYNLHSVGMLSGCGIIACAAQVAMTRAYGAGNLLLSSLLQFSGILFGCLIGWIWMGEQIAPLSVAGMLIIIVSGTYATMFTKKLGKKS